MVTRSGRYLEVLVVIKVPMLSAVTSFVSLVVLLLVCALVLHLLHAVVKSEVALGIPATHRNHSMNYIIAWHVLVIVWAHVLAALSIDVGVISCLILTICFEVVLLAPRLVRLTVLDSALLLLAKHCGQ